MSLRNFWNFRNFANFWNLKWQFWQNDQNNCQFFFVIFLQNNVPYFLVQFESDRMSLCESTKNGQMGAHGWNWKIFEKSEVKFEIYEENYPRIQIFMSLRRISNFANFWNFRNFKWPFWPNGQNNCQFFFVIFSQDYVIYIFVEFGSDRMSPCESTKNGRMGAHGLNWKIFVKSDAGFAIYDKNYPRKKILRFLGRIWNLRFSTEPHPTYIG